MVVCNQAIYSKALEFYQKHQQNFEFVVFIARRCDAELRDVAIESGVITVRIAGRALDGKT